MSVWTDFVLWLVLLLVDLHADVTRITFVGGTACLEISSVSKTDMGDYLCKASNATGSDFCKSRVTVKGRNVW